MEREDRYLVMKRTDVEKYLSAQEKDRLEAICMSISDGRAIDDKREMICVVVESHWPEYEVIWKAIEKRVDASKVGNH